MSDDEFIKENAKRYAVLFSEYNPMSGKGSPLERFPLTYCLQEGEQKLIYLPTSMDGLDLIKLLSHNNISQVAAILHGLPSEENITLVLEEFNKLRFKHDFEFWSFLSCKIQDKITKKIIPFRMRLAQRILFKELEDMRLAGVPIRLILLKARQYGGSTLIQLYMLWIQTELMENWHSAVCAVDEGQSRNIRGMYVRAAKHYPVSMGSVTLVPYLGSSKNKFVKERGCIIGIGSMQMPDNLRSYDFSMLHMSEVGLYKETLGKKPEDLVQTLRSSLPEVAMSLEVLESTAKGVGNFFHKEWLDAKNLISGYKAVFVPWFMIDLYLRPVENYHDLIVWINDPANKYYKFLWDAGATLEGINWYRKKKIDNRYSDWRMQSEFPTTDTEAFSATGARVFAPDYVQMMRRHCYAPEYVGQLFAKGSKGKEALEDLEFQSTPDGNLWIWCMPDKSVNVKNRYLTTLDIGGRTDLADFSTVRVFDRYWRMFGGVDEAIVTWKGHLDQDLFAWVGVQIAKFYNDSLFIVESNSLRKEKIAAGGDHYLTILDEIAEFYDNVFTRIAPDKVKGNPPVLYGLHMGHNKVLIIDSLNGALRDQSYIERDARVLDECDTYEFKPDGSMGAVDGCHDDLVIPTAMGTWASNSALAIGPPEEVEERPAVRKSKIVSEASI
jgi:hypothetical protein